MFVADWDTCRWLCLCGVCCVQIGAASGHFAAAVGGRAPAHHPARDRAHHLADLRAGRPRDAVQLLGRRFLDRVVSEPFWTDWDHFCAVPSFHHPAHAVRCAQLRAYYLSDSDISYPILILAIFFNQILIRACNPMACPSTLTAILFVSGPIHACMLALQAAVADRRVRLQRRQLRRPDLAVDRARARST